MNATRPITSALLLIATACTAIALAVLCSAQPCSAQAPPGYAGDLPTDAGREALAQLEGRTYRDDSGLLGGGEWQVQPGGVTPYPPGPGRSRAVEARSCSHKGPHARLVQRERAFSVPTETDGDVAMLWQLVRGEPHPMLRGETSAAARDAWALIRAFGPAAFGLRAAVVPAARQGHVQVVVYNCSDENADVTGTARLVIDGIELPVELHWPRNGTVAAGASRLVLKPGSRVEHTVDVRATAAAAERAERARDGRHVVRFELTPSGDQPPRAAGGGPAAVCSCETTIALRQSGGAADAGGARRAGAEDADREGTRKGR